MRLFDRFLSWLEKRGRKRILVDVLGNIIASRHYVFFVEEDDDPSVRWPNVFIHHNLRLESPDGPDAHQHPWATWSFILRGGYWEEVDGVKRYNPTHSIARMKVGQFHRITQVDPGTVTLFFHGFRRVRWLFKETPCETVCDHCKAQYGRCFNATHTIPYNVHFGVMEPSAGVGGLLGKGVRRGIRWLDDTPEVRDRISRLRRRSHNVKPIDREVLRHEHTRARARAHIEATMQAPQPTDRDHP